MKSHTPECVKIEQFAATLVPVKSYHLCFQDFNTKDYTPEIQGRFITITQEQFDDGTWQEIVKQALQWVPTLIIQPEGAEKFGFLKTPLLIAFGG